MTTDGADIFISCKTEPLVICAISLTSASVKDEGEVLPIDVLSVYSNTIERFILA